MYSTFIRWRRLDRPGHDVALLTELETGSILEGTAVFVEDDQPCRLDYRIESDTAWRTMSVRVTGLLGARTILVDIAVGGRREWTVNGRACPDVYGCDDIDLSFSPATNLLPIRRLGLGTGQRAPVRAAWLRFPACALEPLDQNYERVGHGAYRYESDGGFTAMLTVNAVGFVTCYPGLWEEESSDTLPLRIIGAN